MAIRPALGRTVRFFKALSGAASSRTRICPPFWDTSTGHRSVAGAGLEGGPGGASAPLSLSPAPLRAPPNEESASILRILRSPPPPSDITIGPPLAPAGLPWPPQKNYSGHAPGPWCITMAHPPPPPAGHRSVVYYDNPFSSQLVIYRRFVTTLDVRYWRKRYPPASVWNHLGSHKPVRGGKRRAESTPFALVVMVRVMVRVSVIYHRDRVITGANGRCRLWSSLTNANGFMRTQIGAHLPSRRP